MKVQGMVKAVTMPGAISVVSIPQLVVHRGLMIPIRFRRLAAICQSV